MANNRQDSSTGADPNGSKVSKDTPPNPPPSPPADPATTASSSNNRPGEGSQINVDTRDFSPIRFPPDDERNGS
ncbi:hypothetical protein NW754_011125 [Fusarium falciforme]|nr:hypothetical protein NW754_011125 [Fusarium falciforme]